MIHLRPQPTEATAAPKPVADLGLGIGRHPGSDRESPRLDPAAVVRLRNTGVSRHRVDVRWNEIILDHGVIDLVAVELLSDTIDLLLDGGIEPLVALDNVAVPDFLAADGGWLNLATARAYGNFAGVLGARLGDRVDEWIIMATPELTSRNLLMRESLTTAQAEATLVLRAHCPLASIDVSNAAERIELDAQIA